ncbi:MAG: M14 family metallopeptidase [Myxococcota bacterium]
MPKLDLSRLTILWVHAVNPWGFRHRRRVTEGNIDLNRNFDPHPTRLFDTTNDAYAELDDFLNPTMPVSLEKVDQAMAEVYARASNIPRSRLRQAILQGQYQFPEGMYFGGRAFAPQKQPLEALLKEHIAEHQAVLTLDLHTGFGRRGHMHLFGAPGLGDPEAMAAVFDGYTIDTGANNEDFYETTGDFIVYAGELSAGKTALGVTLEYGTLDSQTELGAAQSLVNMRLENQGFHHGYLDEAARDQAQAQFMEMFNPSDPAWRRTILDTTRSALPVWLERFVALP